MLIPGGISRLMFAWVWERGLASGLRARGASSGITRPNPGRGCVGWTNAVAELQGWLTRRRDKMHEIPPRGDWGPPTGGLSRLHSLDPPIHTIVGDFSPWLTPDSPFLSFRLTKEAWTSLHALRPQLESWLGIRALVWLLHVDVDRARTVLSQICKDLENSTHPICEHVAVVAPCGVGMSHHGLTTPLSLIHI